MRRLFQSDSLFVELDWQEVGAFRFRYSLGGAAAAIRQARTACGVE